jgi:hypothetical protein
LSRAPARLRRTPKPAMIVLVIGLTAVVLIFVFKGSSGAAHTVGKAVNGASAVRREASSRGATGTPRSASGRGAGNTASLPGAGIGAPHIRLALRRALDEGVEQAHELGGEAAAAVWIAGDAQPILSGPVSVAHRMWSMSKAVVTIAALQAVHDDPDPVLALAMQDAIRRSDNCAIRRVIVGLQDLLGEGVSGTVSAFEGVLARAGARLARTPQAAAAESACFHYLESNDGLPGGDLGVAPQFGTAEWTEDDAIRFAHALSEREYGRTGAYLLRLMSLPKLGPLEEPPPPSAPPLDWGAGEAFPAGWAPAWKAGWGGSQDQPPHFLAGQIVVLDLAGVPVAASAVFVPTVEPPNDNPGITRAPEALATIFRGARVGLEDEHVGQVGT